MKVKMSQVALLTAALTTIAASGNPALAGNFANNHPRRAQVLGRDGSLNRRMNRNEGNLGGALQSTKA